jgi:hypothetical protein
MVTDLSREKNRLAKVFTDVGVRLGAIVSDFHGVDARRMAECLINGSTPEMALKAVGNHKLPTAESDLLAPGLAVRTVAKDKGTTMRYNRKRSESNLGQGKQNPRIGSVLRTNLRDKAKSKTDLGFMVNAASG